MLDRVLDLERESHVSSFDSLFADLLSQRMLHLTFEKPDPLEILYPAL